jgi:hypothetical protein
METLQAQPGEDEDTAWRRLRPKLSFTGRQLDEVTLLKPSAVPTTGGSTPATTAPTGTPNPGGLFGEPILPTENESTPGGFTTLPPSGGGIFGGGSTTAGARPRVALNNPATSPLNLIGRLEGWGIGPATQLNEVSIKLSAATGAQLRELLKKLPDGMTFELNLEKEDN